jgi:broad specificity phosphatase PhoE
MIHKRIIKTVEKIYKKHKNKTILISGHGGTVRSILMFIKNIPVEKYREMLGGNFIQNSSVSIIKFHETGKHKIVLDNSIKHLEV